MKKLSLANTPTRIEQVQLMDADLPVNLFVKRDDMTGVSVTGNKIRKLEYLLQQALDEGATDIITTGAVGSNHARATAMACARLGFQCHLLLVGPEDAPDEGNLFLDRLAGAEVRFISQEEYDARRDEVMGAWKEELDGEGKNTLIIPVGGSNGLGSFGYVDCFDEILAQEKDMGITFDAVVCVAGSAGMLAGLAYGNALRESKKEIIGISVAAPAFVIEEKLLPRIVNEMNELKGTNLAAPATIIDDYVGRGYALSREEELEFIWDFVSQTGIILDPVYTGKAMYGTVSEILNGRWEDKENILFIHSGGAFGWTSGQIRALLRKE